MIKKTLVLALSALASIAAHAQTFDNSFKPIFAGPSEISAMIKQPDDKVIIAGNFVSVGGTHVNTSLVRLNTDGTLDNTFNAGTGANATIYDLALEADGQILVGGYFTIFNGEQKKNLVRLNSDGTIDNTFDLGTGPSYAGNSWVLSIAVQADGKIIVQGNFDSFNGLTRKGIVRLNANGSVDTGFSAKVENLSGTGSGAARRAMVIQSDNKIVIGGEFTKVNDVDALRLARLNADGTLDATFMANLGTGLDDVVADIGLQSDGKIVFLGNFTKVNSATANFNKIARLNTDGTVDATFTANAGFNSGNSLRSIKVLANDKIIVGGNFQAPTKRILRLNANGSLDNTFDVGTGLEMVNTIPDVYDIAEQTNNTVVIAGKFVKYNTTNIISLARLNTDGTIDATYTPNPAGAAAITDVKVLSDGKLLVCGDFISVNGVFTKHIVKLNVNGTTDNTFSLSGISLTGSEHVTTAAVQSDGKILIGGPIRYNDGTSRAGLARLTATGAYDNTFSGFTTLGTSFSNDGVYAIHVQTDDKIIIGGSFSTVNGTAKTNFARLESNGALDNTFNTANEYTVPVYKINVRASDGRMIMPQVPTSGSIVPAITLAESNGSKVSAFNINSKFNGSYVNDAVFLPDGKILIGGDFTVFDGTSVKRLVKVDDAGIRDASFLTTDSYTKYTVRDLYVTSNGKVFIGKGLNYYNDTYTESNFIDIIESTGAAVPEGLAITGFNVSVIVPSGSSYYLAGSFHRCGSTSISSLLRINTPAAITTPPSALSATTTNGPKRVVLNWTDNTSAESGFEIQRSTANNGNFTSIGTVGENITTYTDQTGLANQTVYYYRVRAVNMVSQTAFSNEINITTLTDTPPAAPSGLVVKATSDSQITVTWTDNANNETGFEIYRSTPGNSSYALAGSVPANTATFTDNNALVIGTVYYYKVRSVLQNVFSGYSPEVNITMSPGTPSNLTATAVEFTKIRLNWTDNSSQETGFNVYRIDPSANVLLANVGANVTEFLVEGLSPNTSYTFQVRAIKNTVESVGSANASSTTLSIETGIWTQPVTVSNVPARSSGIAFVIGSKAYIGLGQNAAGTLKDLWEFDPANNTWIAKANFPGNARIGAVAFVINGKGYVGTGNDFSGNGFLRDFYEYDPISNTWTKKADFPEDFSAGAGITSGAAFAIGNYGYVGLGNTGSSNTTAFYRYDPATNVWQSRSSFGGPGRTGAVGFANNDKGYFAFGYGGLSSARKDLWQYDPTTDAWSQRIDYNAAGRGGAAAFMINGEAFLVAGDEGDFFTSVRTNKVTRFSFTNGQWSTLPTFPAPIRTSAVAFAIGSKGYLFAGSNGNTYYNDLLVYTHGSAFLPSAPTSVTASYVSDTSLKITWTDTADNETGFVLEVSTAGSSYTAVTTTPANSTEYVHTGLIANTQYIYRIRSTNAYGSSANVVSNTVFTTPAPAAPSNLNGSALSSSSIKITWTDNSTTETGFEIYRSNDGVTFVKIATLAANIVEYTDNSLTANKEYTYKVLATGTNGNSTFSATKTIQTLDVLPLAPTNLLLVTKTQAKVEIKWTDNSSNEAGFRISRALGSGSFELIHESAANVTTYTDTNVAPGNTYVYRVRSYNAIGQSNNIELSVAVTVSEAPEAPTQVSAEFLPATLKVTVTWKDNSLYEDGFEIFREDKGSVTPYASVGKDVTTYTDQNLTSGLLTYTYRVRAKNSIGNSANSEPFTLTLTPGTIVGIEDTPSLQLQAYPNPVSLKLIITNNSHIEADLSISSQLGVKLVSGTVPANGEIIVDCSEWSAGIYLLQSPAQRPQKIIKR